MNWKKNVQKTYEALEVALLDLFVKIIQNDIVFLVGKMVVDQSQQLLLPALVHLHHISQLLLK
jgi:ABC-type ATPase involved in cell division